MTVRFNVLGPPKFVRKGKTVRLHSAKAAALLATLVCQPEVVHSRDRLATLFWGSFPEAKARQSLRQALYSLRRALGESAQASLVVDAQTISFQPNPSFQVDILEFNELIAAGELKAAVDLYQGTLLEGIVIDDCPEFDEWLFLARDQVVQRLIEALQGTIDEYLAVGRAAQAIPLGQRLVTVDNLNEGVYRRLMRAYAALGDLDAVSRTYRQCREILEHELGIEPAKESRALFEQLLSSADVQPPAPPLSSPIPTLALPFVGCEDELAQLHSLFAQAAVGQISLAFVKGESGSGKSELLFEFWRRASSEQPLLLLTGHAFETELGAPYVMWSEAVAPLNTPIWQQRLVGLSPIWREQLARLVPGMRTLSAEEISLSAAENQLRFMQGIVQALIHLAHDTPLLLFFDDLQWSDTASLELLHYAARQCRSHPILFVGAYSSDSAGTVDRLRSFIDESRTPTIEVSALQPADIKRFLSLLGLPTTTTVIAHLHQHCQGSRLMLVETVRLLQETGEMDELEGMEALPIPPRIQDLIRTRLARLTDQQRRVLAAASVIGRPFDDSLLRQVSGQPELALLSDVDTLIARSFLDDSKGDNGHIAFHHDFARQITYDELGDRQRQALHRRTADALLAVHQSRPDLVVEEVATHYEQAEDVRALTYLLLAAEQAESFYALPQATHLLSRALAFQEQHLAEDKHGHFDILITRERILAQQGRRAARATDIATLLALAEAMADPRRLAQATVRQAGFLGEMHQSQESMEAAEKALSLYYQAHDRLGVAKALRELGYICWSSAEFGLALDYGRQALKLHRQLGDIEGEATALHNLAEIYRGLDSPRQAVRYYKQSLQLNWARQDHQRQALSLYGMTHALRQLGRRQQALQTYEQTLAETDLAGDRILASRVYHGMASLLAEIDELDRAVMAMEQAASISRDIGHAPGVAHSLFGLSYLYARSRRTNEARTALRESAEWFKVMEDDQCLELVKQRLRQLDQDPSKMEEPPAQMGWVRTYVTLVEGKVYCEYESPLARTV